MSTAHSLMVTPPTAPQRPLGIFAALPPALIVASAAALAYTEAPKLEPSLRSFFAPPPPIIVPQPPAPAIDPKPVASIAAPPPAPAAPQVTAPAPAPVAPQVRHVVKKPVAHERRVIAVQEDEPPPPVRYVDPLYRRPAYPPPVYRPPVRRPVWGFGGYGHPYGGGHVGRPIAGFGGFGGLFGHRW